ncbi:Mu transposase C-terminal domain-containing protein [Undibacterium crateris]|uniref:Mu transposase C-terminal domain-containing protein n=1 Tax=Undibacterium crateris TaxID=2528175 RepID=UPI0013896FE2|nr:Mu transposase C-terminal domain-containing protein [Undibacterium crateris]NDI85465.1 DDE-type integrase/transposase/recombinase [Undibacterium crateris]
MQVTSLPLREGSIVNCADAQWRIVWIEGFDRVLAERVVDSHREYLAIPDLKVVEWNANSLAKTLDTEPSPPTSLATSIYAVRLKQRQVRAQPVERDLSDTQKQDSVTTSDEFQFAQMVLAARRQDRRKLIAEMAERFGYSTPSVYRRLKILKQHNSADALHRAVRSDAGVKRLSKEVLDLAEEYLRRYRFIETPKSMRDVIELLNGKCRELGLPEISQSTVYSIEQRTPLKKRLQFQGRKNQVRDQYRPKAGHLPGNDYPLAIVQVDHTPCQICFVDEIDRQPIGDAWLTIVIDTYSRMILGYYVTFEAPSTLSTSMALAHAFLPKEKYLRDLGISGEWPCWGFPDLIHVDNGGDLNGRMMHGARRKYRFNIRNRPVGGPNFGGHVESAFRTFMFEIKSLPGTKFSNPTERAEYDSEGRAVMTLAEFDRLFADFLVNDYHLDEHSGDGMNKMTPLQRWRKGIFEGDVMPPRGLPERPVDELSLRLSLMPFEMRTVRQGQVKILGEEYYSGALTLLSDSIDLTKPLSDRKFEVHYDPRNISKVWLYDDTSSAYIEVPFADLRKSPISKWENDARKRRRGNPAEEFKEERYQSKIRRLEMVEESAKKTKQTRRETEKAARRERTALVQPPPVPKPSATTTVKKQGLDPTRLARLKNLVREAPIPNDIIEGTHKDDT